MPQGLQVFDASGNIILDTSTRVLKRAAEITYTANSTATQSVAIPAGASFASIVAIPTTGSGDGRTIKADVVGGNLNYAARDADGITYKLNVVFY